MSKPTVEIEAGSEAYNYLEMALSRSTTYRVRLDVRESGVAVKVNEGMWTHTMGTGFQCEGSGQPLGIASTCGVCGKSFGYPHPANKVVGSLAPKHL